MVKKFYRERVQPLHTLVIIIMSDHLKHKIGVAECFKYNARTPLSTEGCVLKWLYGDSRKGQLRMHARHTCVLTSLAEPRLLEKAWLCETASASAI